MAVFTVEKGNLFQNLPDSPFVLVHVVNAIGVFGAGFAKQLAQRYPRVEQEYRQYTNRTSYNEDKSLWGTCFLDYITPENDPCENMVANLYAMKGLASAHNRRPLRYTLLVKSLNYFSSIYRSFWYPENKGNPHHVVIMPEIGSGLAGGNIDTIKDIVQEILVEDNGFNVTMFKL